MKYLTQAIDVIAITIVCIAALAVCTLVVGALVTIFLDDPVLVLPLVVGVSTCWVIYRGRLV